MAALRFELPLISRVIYAGTLTASSLRLSSRHVTVAILISIRYYHDGK
jgi:hypothetical protein